MRLSTFIAAAAVAAALSLIAAPADAATNKKRVAAVSARGSTVFVSRDENGRARTRIIIQRRSYLDGGTEVLPGDRKFTDYAIPPNHSATGVIDRTTFANRSAFPGPFDLPSKFNPIQW